MSLSDELEAERLALVALDREEDRELAARFDAPDLLSLKVPSSEWINLRERQRLRWVAWTDRKNDVRQVEHRTGPTKSEQLLEFVKSNTGQVYTVKALAQAADCSESTVHKVITDNPGYFRKGMFAGTYEFLDPDVERAREAESNGEPAHSPPQPRNPLARTQPAGDPFAALLGGKLSKEEP